MQDALNWICCYLPGVDSLSWKQIKLREICMKPSAALEPKRAAVREAVSRFRTANPRVFGSVLHGTDADKCTQQAIIMSPIINGEAAAKVMDRHVEFSAQHSEAPLRCMRGMRNHIAQGHFDINLDVVWETVQSALPGLLKR